MTRRELQRILSFTVTLAHDVGDYVHKGSAQKKKVHYKGEVNLVTQYDRISQSLLVERCKENFPHYGVLSEENITITGSAPGRWIIDPLDGTTNFAHGLPIWTLSIAFEYRGEILSGVVYDPTRKETFHAVKGKGAYLNRKKIKVSRIRKLTRALLVTGFPYDIRESKKNNLEYFNRFALCAQAVRRLGSAALDLCYTACGRFDGYWELKLSPWDQAAGSLIMKEAGGMITDFSNKPFSIYGNEVLATNGSIHRAMLRVIQQPLRAKRPRR